MSDTPSLATDHISPPLPTAETSRVSGKHPSALQCVHMKDDGTRCANPPIKGGKVCLFHGGGLPTTRYAAQKLLLSTVNPAIATLVEALHATDYLGDPVWMARIAAAKTLLSRAGHGEQAKLVLEAPDSADDLSSQELAETLEKISQEIRTRNAQRALSAPSSDTLVSEDKGETWHNAA